MDMLLERAPHIAKHWRRVGDHLAYENLTATLDFDPGCHAITLRNEDNGNTETIRVMTVRSVGAVLQTARLAYDLLAGPEAPRDPEVDTLDGWER
ncbi:hypothetical protein [Corynebacterium ureicelerivorans]|uniref:Uncharacterized protein n=1 Tax=Corynebacterium ureicelerivorans TaxID=401472 RepID=A0A077HLA2_9CORY|nr:hypothetical protein [Corynebacterium ureicelerivorans]AIL96394.1 hypothetical protein CUREI_02945 [Corynebacterium ureicelerivorans]AIL97798.1 hypothetical protein CUREI_11480 [Corynebacterium ureicelerivorans]